MGPWGVKFIALEADRGLDGCERICTAPYSHCINQITVDEVVDATKKFLEKIVVRKDS